LFALGPGDAALQERAFGVYNDWVARFCEVAPDRLVAIGLVSSYDADHAVAEMSRCREIGMPGVMIWQVPPPDLPLWSDHYEPIWEAATDLRLPISLHTFTGNDWGGDIGHNLDFYRKLTNHKLLGILDSFYDLVFGGVFDRHPALQVVLVENEIGWIPWMLQNWDRYFHRSANPAYPHVGTELAPSYYFGRNVHATFFEDAVGAAQLGPFGVDNCMWSSDYPHANSTWPHSRETIAAHLAHLSPDDRTKVLCTNVCRLYELTPPPPLTR
jgi:predicted TIM-barrel fold metal-dependent hydrolase